MAGDRDKTRVQLFEDVKVLRQQVAEYEEQNTKYRQVIDELKEIIYHLNISIRILLHWCAIIFLGR